MNKDHLLWDLLLNHLAEQLLQDIYYLQVDLQLTSMIFLYQRKLVSLAVEIIPYFLAALLDIVLLFPYSCYYSCKNYAFLILSAVLIKLMLNLCHYGIKVCYFNEIE